MDILKLIAESGGEFIELCHGRTYKGDAFHAFVKMTMGQYRDYHEKLAKGGMIDLNACGAIIHTGWGDAPDGETRERILREHTDNLKITDLIAQERLALDEIIRKHSAEGSAHV